MTRKDVLVPGDVPRRMQDRYVRNFFTATKNTGKLMMFAGDQRIEHLNNDFRGKGIASGDNDPEHMWLIANEASLGIYATQLGAAARYGPKYKQVPLIVKLNSKTNLVKTKQKDPLSLGLHSVDQVVTLQQEAGLRILGIGYTIYIGSEFEHEMLHEAAQAIWEAHQSGMISVIWIYPRGKAVPQEKTVEMIAGATGVANHLGADFVKVNMPEKAGKVSPALMKDPVQAGGNTGVITAGGGMIPELKFYKLLKKAMDVGVVGTAVGRNVHQKPLKEAVLMCNALSSMVYAGYPPEDALQVYQGKKRFNISHV